MSYVGINPTTHTMPSTGIITANKRKAARLQHCKKTLDSELKTVCMSWEEAKLKGRPGSRSMEGSSDGSIFPMERRGMMTMTMMISMTMTMTMTMVMTMMMKH